MGVGERQILNLRRLVKNKGFDFTNTFKTYTSGEIGPYYVQSAVVLKNPDDYIGACKDMENLIRENAQPEMIDVISGGATRDWIFSLPMTLALKVPHAMIYKNEKVFGADMQGKKVVHVADLNNEGSSPRDYWVPAIKKAGGNINQIFFYVDRMEEGVNEMKKLGLKSHALVPLDETAWDILLKDKVISKDIYRNLRQRMEDKYKWAKEMLMSDRGLERLAELTMDPETTKKVINILCVGYPFLKGGIVERLGKKYGEEVTSKLPVFGL